MWALADTHGIIYNIDICQGATQKQDDHPDIGSTGNLVLKLSKLIPDNINSILVMDSYFSGIPLYLELLKRGIFCMGTVKLNRVPAIDTVIISDKDLKAKGKSSYIEYEGKLADDKGNVPENAAGIRLMRWNDNKIFTIMSTFGSAQPSGTVQRWDRSKMKQTKETVPCPGLVQFYNTNMGGVDKMDSLMGFYRLFLRSKKWYHRIFFHIIDLSVNNAWLLYRRDFEQDHVNEKPLSLYEFKLAVSYTLRNQHRPLKRVGRPSTNTEVQRPNIRGTKRSFLPQPVIDDQVGHFPISVQKRGVCQNPLCKSVVKTCCMKCKMFLCIFGSGKQCFLDFHGIDYNVQDFQSSL